MYVLDWIANALRLGCAVRRRQLPPPESNAMEPMTPDEMNLVLESAARTVPDAPDWRNSIVDLLKILRLDSGYTAREKLWGEFNQPESYKGLAEQNEKLRTLVIDALGNRQLVP